MSDSQAIGKFKIVLELMELSERAFLFKLKKKYHDLTEDQIKAELVKWYHDRPGAEFGDGVGTPGDPKRFE